MIMYRTVVYLSTARFSFLENVVSRFGLALNRSVYGNVDRNKHYSDEWSVGEKEEGFYGEDYCDRYKGFQRKKCMGLVSGDF
jgi:hypothetical protein